jgi:hypothetical protein
MSENCKDCGRTFCEYSGQDKESCYLHFPAMSKSTLSAGLAPPVSYSQEVRSVTSGQEKSDDIKFYSDCELLKEFKRRFCGSVLWDVTVCRVLEIIGEKKVKSWLKEMKEFRKKERE